MAKAKKAIPVPSIPDEIKYVKRKIHYHDLHIKFRNEFKPVEDENPFVGFFSIIAKMVRDKDKRRYVPVLDAQIFLQDVKFIPADKKITGKLLYVKMDVFPELIDIDTDETQDIETDETQGLVETTHFIIDYSKATKKIAIEYNHAGAKISDFMTYCYAIGGIKNATESVRFQPIAKNELAKFKQRIAECSSIICRVHKDNIPQIEAMDEQLFTMFSAVKDQYETEYVEINLKFDYKNPNKQPKVKATINNLIDGLIEDKENLEIFETLKVNAVDRDNNFRMHIFNLLMDKVESEVKVQRKPKHKVIISKDMFAKIEQGMTDKRI